MQLSGQPLHAHHFRTMGSEISVWLIHENAEIANTLLRQAQALMATIEARMSRFRATSELSAVNRASGQWSFVSRPLWQVIWSALQLAGDTAGLFDPTVLTDVLAAGYDGTFDAIGHGAVHRDTTRQIATGRWQAVAVDPERHAIRLPLGIGLDLGGIAKGFTAEQMVNFLGQWAPCLVDAGGDLTAGDGPDEYPGWPVAVAMPSPVRDAEPESVLSLWLNNATLATSGIDYRRWQQDGQPVHHLIDPRTGLPAATDVVTASVLCSDARRAEAWATATLVAGCEIGLARLHKQQLAGVIIDNRQQIHQTDSLHRYRMADAQVAI